MSQTIYLTGIADDGSYPSPETPAYTAQLVTVPRGGDVTIYTDVFYPSGMPVVLANDTSATAVFTVRSQPDPFLQPAIQYTLGPGIATASGFKNRIVLSIVPSDTAQYLPNRYWFDFWLTYRSLRYQIIQTSVFIISPTMSLP